MELITHCPAKVATWSACSGGTFVPAPAGPLGEVLGMGPDCQRTRAPETGFPLLAVVDRAEGSQFDALLRGFRQRASLPDSAAAIALSGRKFHGQRGRPWQAMEGNIHLSAYFSPQCPLAPLAPALTMLPAVAALRTIQDLLPDTEVGIKWVNDLLIQGQKTSGVLTSTITKGLNVETVLFGIGMNVGVAPEIVQTPFVPATTCLAKHGSVDFSTVLFRLLQHVTDLFKELLEQGPDGIARDYVDHNLVIGRAVRIAPEDEDGSRDTLVRGVVTAIHPDLCLQLEGRAEPVTRGRLAFD